MASTNSRGRSTGRTTPKQTKVALDLDKLDDEGRFGDIPPFTFRHGGKVFTMGNPDDVDIFDVIDAGSDTAAAAIVFARLLGDQLADLRAVGPMPARKVNQVMDAYQQHYGGLDQGEAPASVASSNGTAAR